jgi:caffeoyl-CoA O-methyltransferase
VPFATALVATDRPDHDAGQLLARLGQHAETTRTPDGRAVLAFAAGRCVVSPLAWGLELIASAADPARLGAVQEMVAGCDGRPVQWSAPVSGDEAEPVHPVAADYCAAHSTPPGEVLADLAAETRAATGGAAGMQVSADEGGLLTMLTRLAGARLAVEVGTFTGYSSICIARGLAAGGRLITCDVSREWAAIAERYWEQAGLADRIELKIGPALETLRALPAETVVDFAFIDADKEAYPAYYEELLRRLRPGGVIALDNVFLGGRAFDPACQEEHHVALRDLSRRIAADQRVDAVMLSVRDGLTVARKRE